MQTYILNLDSQCNQRCLICMVSNAIEQGHNITYGTVCRQIIIAKNNGYKKIDFYGGEPTTYPFLIKSIKFANDLGLSCILATNAVKFASDSYTTSFFSTVSIDAVRTTLHSHQAKIHDMITQIAGNYKKTLKGIENILKFLKSKRLCVNIVITSLNYKDLIPIVKFIHKIGVAGVKFSGLSISGRILDNKFLIINSSLIQKYLLSAIEVCNKLGLYFFIEKLPLCIMGNLKLEPHHFIQEHNNNFIKIKGCYYCRHKKLCIGIEKHLLMLYGVPKYYENYEAYRY